MIISIKFLKQYDAACILITEQGNSCIHSFLEIPEAYDIAKGLNAVQYTVCPAKCLDQSVHLQVFVNPERVQRRRIETSQEHIDNDQKIQLFVLHPKRYVFIIVLESFAVSRVVRMEHLVIIPDRTIQEVAAGLVQSTGILTVFFIQKISVRLCFISSMAVNGSDPQHLCRIRSHLLPELLIVEPCHLNRSYTEDGVEAADTLLLFHFFYRAVFLRGNILDIHQGIEEVGLISTISLLVEMLKNVLGYHLNAFGSHEGFLAINIPDSFIVDIRVCIHGFDIIHTERQYIFVIDGIHNGIGVELVSEGLFGRKILWIPNGTGIRSENRSPSKSEQMISLEALDNGRMHIAKLAAMAFVKNDDHMLLVDLMTGIFLDKCRKLLYGRNDDMCVLILQLAFQNHRAFVAVGCAFFETVIFLHSLVVQIFSIHYKENLVDIWKLRGLPGCLEGCQGLSGARCVPDIAAPSHSSVFLVIVCDLDTVQDPFRRRYLIWPHDHQHVLGCKNAILGQDIQYRMPSKEGAGKIDQVWNHTVTGICPETGKFKTVAGLLFLLFSGLRVLDGIEPSAVGIILRVGAVADHKNLNILKQTASSPE